MTRVTMPLPIRGWQGYLALGPLTLYAGRRLDLPPATRARRGHGWLEVDVRHLHAGIAWR